jgi:hypothetical protein
MPLPLALAVIVAAGLFLTGLGAAALVRPDAAGSFLIAFATTPQKHYLELAARFTLGAAFLRTAPGLPLPTVCVIAGWVLVATTAVMLLVPWRTHRAFAERTVPAVLPHLRLLGLASLVIGIALLRLGSTVLAA